MLVANGDAALESTRFRAGKPKTNAEFGKKEPLVDLVIHRQSARRMAGPVMLIIRDGWGINPGGEEERKENGDATLLGSTPFHEKLYREYPGSKLSASGGDVGLPEGQMGNSEVGHLNLGAGRIVYQDLTRINK